jgi:hypothetical protein
MTQVRRSVGRHLQRVFTVSAIRNPQIAEEKKSYGGDECTRRLSMGQKQTSQLQFLMSALPPKADIAEHD